MSVSVYCLVASLLSLGELPTVVPVNGFPGPAPGSASARIDGECLVLENAVLSARWERKADRLGLVEVTNRLSDTTIRPRAAHEAFVITLEGGQSIKASEFRPAGKPELERIEARSDAVRLSHRFAGWQVSLPLVSSDGRIHATWCAILRDGSHYVRQELTLTAKSEDVSIKEVSILKVDVPDARVIGNVDGSPVVAGNWFFACEHPMAANRVEGDTIVCSMPRFRPVRPGRPFVVSSVIGVTPDEQLRRAL